MTATAPVRSPSIVEAGPRERPALWVIAVVVPLFFCVAEVKTPSAPWAPAAARGLLAAWLLAAAPLALGRWRLVLAVISRPPLVFFTAFSALAFAAVPTAALPGWTSLKYAAGYAAIELACVVTGILFPPRLLVSWVFVGSAVRVLLSLALHLLGPGGGTYRLEGVQGNPNPTGATAGLCLLLGLVSWLASRGDDRRPLFTWRTVLLALSLASALAVLAATRSASAVLVTFLAGASIAYLEGRRRGRFTAKGFAAAAAGALGLVVLPALVASRRTDLFANLAARLSWWREVAEVAWRRPLLGYGPGSGPLVLYPLRQDIWTSAHNVVLEAWVYAGIGAALALLSFVVVLAVQGLGAARRDGRVSGLATIAVFYSLLSLVEPAILNAGPTTLVAPLLSAAWLSAARPGSSGPR